MDAYLPGMDGLELLQRLRVVGHKLPTIMITGNSDVPMAIRAMKAGAVDFIEKPIRREELLAGVERALEQLRDSSKASAWREDAASHLAGLTTRQRQIMEMVLAGHPSKNIAADLRDQPTDCREPSGIDHEEVGIQVASGAGSAGDCRNRKRRRLAGFPCERAVGRIHR